MRRAPIIFVAMMMLIVTAWAAAQDQDDTPKIVTGFACALNYESGKSDGKVTGQKRAKVVRLADNHFKLVFPNGGRYKVGWFLFKIENVKNKNIRIDLVNVPISKWRTLNPVYSYVDDLGALESFKSNTLLSPPRGGSPKKAPNGPLIPDTSGEKWHYIVNVAVHGDTLILHQKFAQDHAYIAMRPPYTPDYNANFVKWVRQHRHARVYTIKPDPEISGSDVVRTFRSKKAARWYDEYKTLVKQERPVDVIQIGGLSDAQARRNPCIVLYAREHADEQDASWVAEGAIRFLLGNSREARILRNQATFLIIPLLDGLGAENSYYDRITHRFGGDIIKTPITHALGNFFQKWVNQNKRIDIVFNIHNVESSESPHVGSAYIEPRPDKSHGIGRAPFCEDLNKRIVKRLRDAGYHVKDKPLAHRFGVYRLGSFLRTSYQALHMPYEVNSQAPDRHLSLHELRAIGPYMLVSAVKYLRSRKAVPLVRGINDFRQQRRASYKKHASSLTMKDAFALESWLQALEGIGPWKHATVIDATKE